VSFHAALAEKVQQWPAVDNFGEFLSEKFPKFKARASFVCVCASPCSCSKDYADYVLIYDDLIPILDELRKNSSYMSLIQVPPLRHTVSIFGFFDLTLQGM
jgi:hypothetical protein